MTEVGAGGGTNGNNGAVGGGTPWFQGKVEADVIAHWQNKGYDVNDPVKVSTELTKAYREAEKMIGAPPAQLIRLPVDPAKDPEAMKGVFQRLGMPLDAKDYEFSALKDAKGEIADKALEATLRAASADAFLPKEAANKIASAITKHLAEVQKTKDAEVAAALADEKDKLAKNWGTKLEANKVVAQNAAAALGIEPAEVAALEKVVGYSRVMELFRNIGTKIGEAKFITPDGGGGTNVMTRDQAKARIAELKADKAWVDRYTNGGKVELRELTDLTKISVGDDVEGRF